MALLKTRTPGRFYDENSGQILVLEDVRIADRYDTTVHASGAVVANDQQDFFETTTNKRDIDANFPATQRLVSTGEELDIEAFGVRALGALGNTLSLAPDLKKAYENTWFEIKLNDAVVAVGHATRFPSGYGLYGQTTENNVGMIENGIPSVVQRPRFSPQEAFTVDKDTKTQAKAIWQDHVWDAANMPTITNKVWLRLYAHGILHKGGTSNT